MILGVIPARGGSKGIPRKNTQPVCGQPLITWTIEAAKQSTLLERCIVSTEDLEIAGIAALNGLEVLDRPPHLAADATPTIAVLQHILTVINADVIVILQPTSPIRSPGLIDRCIRQFRDAKADSLATGFICKYQEYALSKKMRRQDRAGFFYDDGNVYVLRAEMVRSGEQFGKNIERVILDREQNIEVDDWFDLWLADKVLERRAGNGIQAPQTNT